MKVSGHGGAVQLSGKSVAVNELGLQFRAGTTFRDGNLFMENTAGEGGAISSLNTDVWISVLNSTFLRNTADISAGVLQVQSASALLQDSVLDRGEADSGGCVTASGGTLVIRRTQITQCSSRVIPGIKLLWQGGGGCVLVRQTAMLVTDSVLDRCVSPLSDGGGILCTAQSACILSTTNITRSSANYGGAMMCYDMATCSLIRTVVSGNRAIMGGGAFALGNVRIGATNKWSHLSLDRSIISGNVAQIAGGALYMHLEALDNDHVVTGAFTNSTFDGNQAQYGGAMALRLYGTQTDMFFDLIDLRRNTILQYGGTVALQNNQASVAGGSFFLSGTTPNFTASAAPFVPNGDDQYSPAIRITGSTVPASGYGTVIASVPVHADVGLFSTDNQAQELPFGQTINITRIEFKDIFGQVVSSFRDTPLFHGPQLQLVAPMGLASCGINYFAAGITSTRQLPSKQVDLTFDQLPTSRPPWMVLYGNSSLGPMQASVHCPLIATVLSQRTADRTTLVPLMSTQVAMQIVSCNEKSAIAERVQDDQSSYQCNPNSACHFFAWMHDYIVTVKTLSIVAVVLVVVDALLCLVLAAAILFQRVVGRMRQFVLRMSLLLVNTGRLVAIAALLLAYSDINNIDNMEGVITTAARTYGVLTFLTASFLALLFFKMASWSCLSRPLVSKRHVTVRLSDLLIIVFACFAVACAVATFFGFQSYLTTNRDTIRVFALVIGFWSFAIILVGLAAFELSIFQAQPWLLIFESTLQRKGKACTLLARELLRYALPIVCCVSLYAFEIMLLFVFIASNECTVFYFALFAAISAVLHAPLPFLVRGMLGQVRQAPRKKFIFSSMVEYDGIDMAMMEHTEEVVVDSAMIASILPKALIIEPQDLVYHEQIGQGAQAVVFRGRYQNSDVAIKAYSKASFGGPADLKAFFSELKNLINCSNHVNVVRFLGVSNDDEKARIAIVTEFCSKGSLAQVLRKERLASAQHASAAQHATRMTFAQRVHLLAGIAAGMRYLHSKDLVHRDLKAENVLLADDGTPKIADFGVAKFMSSATNLTSGIGTISYLAPESLKESSRFASGASSRRPSGTGEKKKPRLLDRVLHKGANTRYAKLDGKDDSRSQPYSKLTRAQSYDERVDVYSFAVLMYVVLTGRTEPYGDMSDVDVAIGVSRDNSFRPSTDPDEVLAIRQVIDSDNRWIMGLMDECWAADPADRPSFDHISDRLQLMTELLQVKDKAASASQGQPAPRQAHDDAEV